MSLQLHRPDGKGSLEPRVVVERDWRHQLRSPRWGAALHRGRLPALANPEMRPTTPARSIAFWLVLAAATFGILVVGYGIGFWHFPADIGRASGLESGSPRLDCTAHAGISVPVRGLERSRAEADPTVRRRDQRARVRDQGAVR